MRGPGLKLDHDVRRLWTCPACGVKRRLSGNVPSPLCYCRSGGVHMQLTADALVFRRAERITPIPFTKRTLPEGWAIPDVEEASINIATEPVPRPDPDPIPIPIPEPVPPPVPEPIPISLLNTAPESQMQQEATEDFGADLDLPPESITQ